MCDIEVDFLEYRRHHDEYHTVVFISDKLGCTIYDAVQILKKVNK